MITTAKECSKCHQEKPADTEHFYTSKTHSSGWHPWCKQCMKEVYKDRRTMKQPVDLMLSIDPGIEFGWALWNWNESHRLALVPPMETGVVIPSDGHTWAERTELAIMALEEVFNSWNNRNRNQFIKKVICEYPTFMTSAKGLAAADSGSLGKLFIIAGRIMQVASDYGAEFEFVDVAAWKGQLDKGTVIYRIKKRLGDQACVKFRSHSWDAVGLGLYAKAHFE